MASLAAPLSIEAINKLTGSGGSRMGKPPVALPKDGGSSPRVGLYQPSPFFGTWDQRGTRTKQKAPEKKKTKKSGKGLLLGKDSPFNQILILGAIF